MDAPVPGHTPKERLLEALRRQRERQVPKRPDEQTRSEIAYTRASAKLQRYTVLTEGFRKDIEAREKYAQLTFRLICWWVALLFLILVLQGFSGGTRYVFGGGDVLEVRFSLPEKVLVVLLGATTASIIGLFAAVMFYLFPRKEIQPAALDVPSDDSEE